MYMYIFLFYLHSLTVNQLTEFYSLTEFYWLSRISIKSVMPYLYFSWLFHILL